jgi:hypothetical protein
MVSLKLGGGRLQEILYFAGRQISSMPFLIFFDVNCRQTRESNALMLPPAIYSDKKQNGFESLSLEGLEPLFPSTKRKEF